MADVTYPDDSPSPSRRPERKAGAAGILSIAAGTLTAVALVGGGALWTYRLGERDIGALPVLRADRGPIKERPSDPGGSIALHQDVTSYGVVDGAATASAATVIADAPAEPAAEDLPMGQITAPAPSPRPAAAAASSGTPVIAATATIAAPAPDAAPADAEAPSVEEETAEAAPAPPLPPGVGPDRPAPAYAVAPPPRPSDLRARARAAVAAEAVARDDLAARAAASDVQIQLAADPSETVIRQMWDRLRTRHDALLEDRALAVQTTTSGGVVYYRLRVGPFRDTAEARALCTALKDRGQDCIVVRKG